MQATWCFTPNQQVLIIRILKEWWGVGVGYFVQFKVHNSDFERNAGEAGPSVFFSQ